MQRFKNILLLAHGGDAAPVLRRAARLAQANEARLTVMDVIAPINDARRLEERLGLDLTTTVRDRRLEALHQLTAPWVDNGVIIHTKVAAGTPFIEAIRAVRNNGFDLLMKAAEPPAGTLQRLFGSLDMHLLRKCPCPVWIDRPGMRESYRSVLAAVDPAGDDDPALDRTILQLATSLGRREDAVVHVVHAWDLPGESMLRDGMARIPLAELERQLTITRERHEGLVEQLISPYAQGREKPAVHVAKGRPAEVIARVAETVAADLIVMGTVGRTGIPGLIMGNTAEDILQTTQLPVLAVKPAGFVSPIGPD